MTHSDRGRAFPHPSATESNATTNAGHTDPDFEFRRVVSRGLTPEAAAQLTVAGGFPCISVLMSTTPAQRMAIADRERLDDLLFEAERRLGDETVTYRERLMRELRRQARIARDSSTSNALGLFVSPSVSRGWTLPVTVHEKVVIESTFATRDLVRALHRTPPHLVLRVDEFGARVFWVAARVTLLETVERLPEGSPRHVPAWGLDGSGSVPGPVSGPGSGRGLGGEGTFEDRSDLLARVDACMARVRAERPSPLVLAGDAALVGELKNSARWLQRLAGEVVGAKADAPDELFGATALCLADYLHRRGQQTLQALHEAAATDPEQVVAGLDQCWAAVASRVPGTLVIEHGYVHPQPAGDAGEAASHDLVDDLLEHAIEAGNLIAFVDDAQLHEFAGIALLRSR